MKRLGYNGFMRSVCTTNKAARRPLRAYFELTYKCNHRCVHCYNAEDKDKKELSTEEVFSIIDQLFDMGTIHVSFTGGEIFVRRDIMDILVYSRRKGIRVTLMTNGSLITEETVDKLIRLGIDKFDISFLGAKKETFDAVTQVEGSFDRVVSAIKMLRQKGIRPHLKTCAMKVNRDEIEKIADLARNLGASFSYSPFIIPKLNLDKGPTYFRISYEESLDIAKRIRRFPESKAAVRRPGGRFEKKPIGRIVKKKGREGKGLFKCMAGRNTIFINPYGRIKPCLILPNPSYDIRRGSARDGWEIMKRFVDNLIPPKDWKCFNCELKEWCSPCPARRYVNSGDLFGCPDYIKEMARTMKERHERNAK